MWTSEVHTRDPSAHRYPYWAGYGTYASVHLAKDLPSTLPSEKNLFPLPTSSWHSTQERHFVHLMKCRLQSLQDMLQLPNFLVNFQILLWFGCVSELGMFFRVNKVYKMWFGCLVFGASTWSDWPLWEGTEVNLKTSFLRVRSWVLSCEQREVHLGRWGWFPACGALPGARRLPLLPLGADSWLKRKGMKLQAVCRGWMHLRGGLQSGEPG